MRGMKDHAQSLVLFFFLFVPITLSQWNNPLIFFFLKFFFRQGNATTRTWCAIPQQKEWLSSLFTAWGWHSYTFLTDFILPLLIVAVFLPLKLNFSKSVSIMNWFLQVYSTCLFVIITQLLTHLLTPTWWMAIRNEYEQM